MSTLVAQTISNGTVSTSSANVIRGSARAWILGDGGSSTISSSYNVSSYTRNGTGSYTINFTTAFSDTLYAETMGTWMYQRGYTSTTKNTTSFSFQMNNTTNGATADINYVSVAFFR